ncbi:AAA family ATPase [Planctellipticum variicoloris]|uniref:AAA family ATPase n=1 Tax=Planctellipticum variicoloris TaxID=3064265 RepID=UPI0030138312|nr:AAA family ATPase [Planctomycetaceae bacterium SH412]
MQINLSVLDQAVQQTIRPVLIEQGNLEEGPESFLQKKVLPKVRPLLQRESLEADPVRSVHDAFKSQKYLLSAYEQMQSVDFVSNAKPAALRRHVVDLLFGTEPLQTRIETFLKWSKVRAGADGNKSGIGLTAITYLLALSDPDRYAFCKPLVFEAAATALLSRKADVPVGRLERAVTATAFYEKLLRLFRERYALPFRNLLDVHTALYVLQNTYHGLPSWSQLSDSSSPGRSIMHDLNLVLYGPPGTGKTYETIRHAVEICDGTASLDREELVTRYRELQAEERIAFVTFHQSYGYEDFVEGIRPVLAEEEVASPEERSPEVQYECRPGIFKRLCLLAGSKATRQEASQNVELEKATIWKMSLGNTLRPEDAAVYDECIEKGCLLLGYGQGLNYQGCKSRKDVLTLLQKHDPELKPTDFHVQAMDTFVCRMQVGDLVVVSDGNHKFRAIGRISGPYQYVDRDGEYDQLRAVEWLAVFDESLPREAICTKAFSQMTIYQLHKRDLKLDAMKELIGRNTSGVRNHVLIIDEINRGNISKILGELITLLEPDKRIGAENELQVTLPYSGEKFGVPSNVYVIGTMNTADRSIAFLDVALRRRFHFVELMPDVEIVRSLTGDGGVVDGVAVADLLEMLNARIELLYDRDHQIGHSVFLGLHSLAELRDVMCRKVIPLLQEYFYGDWSKICLVLGCPISEGGGPVTKNSHPMIRSSPLKASSLLRGGDDWIEDKVRCEVHPEFGSSSTAATLRSYFLSAFQGEEQ